MGTEVDSTTVTSDNVKLYSISKTTGAATQVELTGIVLDSKDVTNKTIIASPASYLSKSSKYELVLTTGLKDITGKTLASNKEVNFTTDSSSVIVSANGITATDVQGANVAIALVNSSLPANAMQINDIMTLNYDTIFDATTVTNSNVRVKDITTDTYIDYTPSLQGGNAIQLLWTQALVTDHQYQIEVSNVKTAIGDSVANNVIKFKFTANDTTKPAVIGIYETNLLGDVVRP